MGKIKALIVCAGMLSLVPQFGQAADLLPPPPSLEPPMLRGSVEPDSGFYLRGDAGIGIHQIRGTSSTFAAPVPGFQYDSASLGDTAFLGIGAGYQFNSWFRADLTGEYRSSARFDGVESYDAQGNAALCSGGLRCPDVYTGSVRSAVFLANGYVDLGTWYGLTPYVGAGVGLAHNMSGITTDRAIGNTGGGYSNGAANSNFAWALMTGVAYNVNQHLKLELGYRYLNLGSYNSGTIVCQPLNVAGCTQENQHIKIASHDLRFGMRWMFSDAPQPMAMPMPPIVRKY